MITGIVTGDIINSRNIAADKWLPLLKNHFNAIGVTPKTWEIYRGDSFQFEIKPEDALKSCFLLKATIKTIESIDVRLAIGVGKKDFDASKITEANGEVFINSGFAFDNYLKKQNLAVKTPLDDVNEELNLSLSLALLTMNDWTATSAEVMKTVFENPNLTQKEIGKILQVSQASVSKSVKRAGLDEILRLEQRYRKLINQKVL